MRNNMGRRTKLAAAVLARRIRPPFERGDVGEDLQTIPGRS